MILAKEKKRINKSQLGRLCKNYFNMENSDDFSSDHEPSKYPTQCYLPKTVLTKNLCQVLLQQEYCHEVREEVRTICWDTTICN